MSEPQPPPRRPFWNASTLNLAALAGGIAVGWFLGPQARVLLPLSRAILNLLTMLSVPFLVVALVYGLGKLSPRRLTGLARVGTLGLLAIWAWTLMTCVAVSQMFPTVGNASFYSHPAVAQGVDPGILALIVPANPFEAVAKGVVPAVVFFCLLFAWHLVKVENKDRLLDWLDVTHEVLRSMSGALNTVLPFATFILTITALGTLDASMLSQVRVFVLAVAVVAALLTLVIFPAFLGSVTPVGYRRVLRTSIPALLTAFLTASPFASLAQITTAAESLIEPEEGSEEPRTEGEGATEESSAEASTIIPIALNFPTAGSLLTILFVLFAGAAFDQPLGLEKQVKLLTAGVLALFSGSTSAISFLCRLTEIPQDAVSLFVGIGSVIDRFRSVLAAASLIALTALTHYGVRGAIRLSPLRLGLIAAAIVGPLAIGCHAASALLAFPPGIQGYYEGRSVALPRGHVIRQDTDVAAEDRPRSGMARLRSGQPLRVGLQVGRPPFTYRNAKGELAGYSVALTAMLARDLEGQVETVEVDPGRLASDLLTGRVDLVLSPVQIDTERLRTLSFATGFGAVRPVVVFRDVQRSEFEPRCASGDWTGVRVGVRRGTDLGQQASGLVPGAIIVPVDSPDALLKQADLAALLWNDIEAAAWEVTNPAYDALPLPKAAPLLLAYPLRADDPGLQNFVRTWFEMLKTRGEVEALHDEWILGKGRTDSPPAPVNRLLEWMVTR